MAQKKWISKEKKAVKKELKPKVTAAKADLNKLRSKMYGIKE